MQTDNTFIFVDNNFASTKEEAIKSTKIITKDVKYSTLAHPLKFNSAQIKIDSKCRVRTEESHVEEVFSVTNHAADLTSFIRV